MTEQVKLSKVEDIKNASRGLRGGIAGAIAANAPKVSDDDGQLLKFHGSYGQYNRDTATERKKKGLDKDHMFMIRARIPGGRLNRDQYLAFDAITDKYADGTLRITTRQTVQLHGVVGAGTLKNTIRDLNDEVVTTLATCGDVVRNVTTSPAPVKNAVYRRLNADARLISEHFLPKTTGYTELWLDGQKLEHGKQDVAEPIYGTTYLPRKFKIGITVPQDNVIDVLSNDLAIISLFDGDRLEGYHFYLGGGAGMTHNKPATYPRIASAIGFFRPDDLIAAVEAVVKLQRDHGDRANRKHARLKYVVEEKGIEWTRKTLARYFGRPIQGPRPPDPFTVPDHLTWNRQGDGKWYLGVPVHSGRITDAGTVKLRTALRHVVQTYDLDVVFSPNQDVILAEVNPQDRFKVAQGLRDHGVALAADVSALQRWSLACPAMPTCGLALAEAEREKQPLIDRLEQTYNKAGLAGEAISIRITGCPNGCARPYSSEIGLVGRMAGHYALYAGGAWDGTRLSRKIADRVPEAEIGTAFRPLFELYARQRRPGQRFGEFIAAQDLNDLEMLVIDAVGEKAVGKKKAACVKAEQAWRAA